MKGTDTEVPALNGKLAIHAEGEIVRIISSPVATEWSWMQIQTLRNRLTKMIDNKRARDRVKFR